MSVEYGIANVPFWAFPLTDEGWKELDERPLFQAARMFSNNAPDSRYFPLYEKKDGVIVESENAEKARYILARLTERGKRYRLTLIDRNWVWAVHNGLEGVEVNDNAIRDELLGGIKHGLLGTWTWAIKEASRLVDTLGDDRTVSVEYMVFNGAEGKDSVENHHFRWDYSQTDYAARSKRMADAFEEVLTYWAMTADFRHRYWAKNPDGSIYRHYHRTLPYEGYMGKVRKVYQETGVHANLGDTQYWLERQHNSFIRYANEWWWHGVIHLNSQEESPQDAWSHETIHRLAHPIERAEYHALLVEPGVEEWLIRRMTEL